MGLRWWALIQYKRGYSVGNCCVSGVKPHGGLDKDGDLGWCGIRHIQEVVNTTCLHVISHLHVHHSVPPGH